MMLEVSRTLIATIEIVTIMSTKLKIAGADGVVIT